MKKHFAQIENNTVVNVASFECETNQIGIDWFESSVGGLWVWSYDENSSKQVGCSWSYHSETKGFSSPRVYASWTLDETHDWQPPTPMPLVGMWNWNETTLAWVEVVL